MKPNIHQYYVYILTNRWKNVLYTGVTNSLERRVWQHKNGAIPGFTKKYNCDRLVYLEIFQNINQAIAREKQIKGWTRARKDALIATTNPDWNDLAADWYSEQWRTEEEASSPPTESS
jgi:putative endonuclease